MLPANSPALHTPVLLIVFNRPSTTRAVFAAIREARPTQLLVIADGPRAGRPGERALTDEVRRIVTAVDWDCELHTDFLDENVGNRRRIIGGLNWAFSLVSEAIILEDDTLPDPSFFPFCAEMLARFRNDARVSMIGGFNVSADRMPLPYSYCFSEMFPIWGWATWRDRWARYDEAMSGYPELLRSGLLAEFFGDRSVFRYWERIFSPFFRGEGNCDTWDYQWIYTNIVSRGMCVVPAPNLVTNLGYGAGATHTTDAATAPSVSAGSLRFPLAHPPALIVTRARDLLDYRIRGWVYPAAPIRAWRKARRSVEKLLRRNAPRDGSTRRPSPSGSATSTR